MAIETITPEQAQQSADAEKTCQESLAQKTEQEAAEAAKKIKEAEDKVTQKLAAIPENTIDNLNKAMQKLMKIINGWEDTSDPDFDPDKVIGDIEKLLNPVVNPLSGVVTSCGLPKIPGLSDITTLLTKLSSMKSSGPKKPGKNPEIPPQLLQTLQDLLAAITSLCTTLPMVCVNILFNTVDLILSTGIPVVGLNFYSIIGMVPFVKEIPQLVKLAPKISELVTNVPGKLNTAVIGKLKQQLKMITDLAIPDAPDDVSVPKTLPACPKDT